MSRRRLSDEERALWKGVTRSVRPLHPSAEDASEAPPLPRLTPKRRDRSAPLPPPGSQETGAGAPPKPRVPPPLAPLGRRLKKRVARGSHGIDARLDLHGMTQSEAHPALLHFLCAAQARGASIALVITGKGSGDAYGERGVLRRQVPMWLRLPEFRSLIAGFDNAGPGHGGDGALYVRLRKRRSE